MKLLTQLAVASAVAGALAAAATAAFAQNSPGMPGGILNDQFRLNEHSYNFV